MLECDLYELVRIWMASPSFPDNRPRVSAKSIHRAYDTSELRWLSGAGDWMRPDVTLVSAFRRKFDVHAELAVHAVEIKPINSPLIAGLFQALSYSRIADFCYLAAPENAHWTEQIKEVSQRFGVGLISFDGKSGDWDSFEFSPAKRMQPDIDLRHDFLLEVLKKPQDRDDFVDVIGVRL